MPTSLASPKIYLRAKVLSIQISMSYFWSWDPLILLLIWKPDLQFYCAKFCVCKDFLINLRTQRSIEYELGDDRLFHPIWYHKMFCVVTLPNSCEENCYCHLHTVPSVVQPGHSPDASRCFQQPANRSFLSCQRYVCGHWRRTLARSERTCYFCEVTINTELRPKTVQYKGIFLIHIGEHGTCCRRNWLSIP